MSSFQIVRITENSRQWLRTREIAIGAFDNWHLHRRVYMKERTHPFYHLVHISRGRKLSTVRQPGQNHIKSIWAFLYLACSNPSNPYYPTQFRRPFLSDGLAFLIKMRTIPQAPTRWQK